MGKQKPLTGTGRHRCEGAQREGSAGYSAGSRRHLRPQPTGVRDQKYSRCGMLESSKRSTQHRSDLTAKGSYRWHRSRGRRRTTCCSNRARRSCGCPFDRTIRCTIAETLVFNSVLAGRTGDTPAKFTAPSASFAALLSAICISRTTAVFASHTTEC